MAKTDIEWATDSWNPLAAYDIATGKRGWFCTKPSEGCRGCYAEATNRFRGNGHNYRVGEADKVAIRLAPNYTAPQRWRKPRRVFVCSMTDLFLEQHTDEQIDDVFDVMARSRRSHQFLVLTKRPARMRETIARIAPRHTARDGSGWPLPHVWLGTTTENRRTLEERLPELLQTPAAVRFLSIEPQLEDLGDLGLHGTVPKDWGYGYIPMRDLLHWGIIGGESGRLARPFDLAWAKNLVYQFADAHRPVFMKQCGSVPMMDESLWRLLHPAPLLSVRNRDRVPEGFVPLALTTKGGNPAEWPEALRVREYPFELATA